MRVAEDDAIGLDELLERLPKNRRILFCGDGLSVHAQTIVEAMGERAMLAPANLRDLRADAVCALAERRREEWIPAQELRPGVSARAAGRAGAQRAAESGGKGMSEITVGLMTVEDVDAVHAIEVACFKTPWSRESFMREVTENACARYVVLREDGRAIAYAGVWLPCWTRATSPTSPSIPTGGASAMASR